MPRHEILRVSQLFATKVIANEFAAYIELQGLMTTPNPLSFRAYTIATYGLCGFANLGSLGIQIGVLGALAPSRAKTIARIAFSAMICGFLSTLQTAGIVYVFSILDYGDAKLHLQWHAFVNVEYFREICFFFENSFNNTMILRWLPGRILKYPRWMIPHSLAFISHDILTSATVSVFQP